jgi:hypothetical protein
MDSRKIGLLSPVLIALSFPVLAQSNALDKGFNYEQVYADLSAGSLNENIGVNSDVSAFGVGGNYQIRRNLFASLDYEARFIHPKETTTEIYTLLPGVFYRFNVHQGLDFVTGAKTGLVWANQTNNETDKTITKDSRLMWGGLVGLRYQLTFNWHLEAMAEFRRSDVIDEEVYTFRGDYYITPRITFGAFYKHREKERNTANEGGVGMKFYY